MFKSFVRTASVLILTSCAVDAYAYEIEYPTINARHLEIGYWDTHGQLIWAHSARVVDENLGDKTSELNWQPKAKQFTASFSMDFDNGFEVSISGGSGSISNGSIVDDDYFSSEYAKKIEIPERFLRTRSSVSKGETEFMEFKLGYSGFKIPYTSHAIFYIGHLSIEENYDAFGVSIVEDPLQLYGPNSMVSADTKVLSHHVDAKTLSIGASFNIPVYGSFSLSTDFGYLPGVKIKSEDTHWLRPDLTEPSKLTSHGDGIAYEIKVNYQLDDEFSLSIGYKALSITSSDGDITANARHMPLWHQDLNRSGVLAQISYSY